MTAVNYALEPAGPPVVPRPPGRPCWWCGEHDPHPVSRSACPVRVVPVAELSPRRRELREVLS